MMKKLIIILSILTAFNGMARGDDPNSSGEFIRAADLSSLPEIEKAGTIFFNRRGRPENPLVTLKNSGMNTVRLRVWKNPEGGHCGFEEVRRLSRKIHGMGLRVWLDIHYSDTWADPSRQLTPAGWKGLSFEALKDSVHSYTGMLVSAINPELVQIGNEINNGFLFPYGRIRGNFSRFRELLSAGSGAVRDNSSDTAIIIHYAGLDGSERFFELVSGVDYDIIGISYYPRWHGKDLGRLDSVLARLSGRYQKDIVIAETAYPFTLEWNDRTHNIVGLKEQLILPGYPATPRGQKAFLEMIVRIVDSVERGAGFCYWGGELVAYRGAESRDGSPWENQALYDFRGMALPVVEAFNK